MTVLHMQEASTIGVLITNPIWLIKTRMQLQLTDSATNYKSALHALQSIVKQDGVLGLYKGIVPALFLTTHGAVQFGSYEKLKQQCNSHNVAMVRFL